MNSQQVADREALPVVHDHSRGYPMRAFVGRSGVWVQRYGTWDRPMHVWLYRGAWRILCFPCMTSIRSDNALYGNGWASQGEAFDAALAHCQGCREVAAP